MKRTPLFEIHKKMGARMTSFSGWEMPLYYKGILEEHRAVRAKAGLFDLSHMGEFWVRGKGAETFLQFATTHDVRNLTDGKALYSVLCNEKGGCVDDIMIYRLTQEEFLLVVNAGNIEKDYAWLKKQSTGDVVLENASEDTALIALQGPEAPKIMTSLFPFMPKAPSHFHLTETALYDTPSLLARTGYTGEDGFEIFFKTKDAGAFWEKLLRDAGTELMPVGLGARDTLRLEAALRLYGQDITEEISPLEAGLSWVVKFEKGDFIGRVALEKQKKNGLRRALVGLRLADGEIPRHGFPVMRSGKKIGEVTSGTHSPTLKAGIALALVETPIPEIGARLQILIRDHEADCEVAPLPFYKRIKL